MCDEAQQRTPVNEMKPLSNRRFICAHRSGGARPSSPTSELNLRRPANTLASKYGRRSAPTSERSTIAHQPKRLDLRAPPGLHRAYPHFVASRPPPRTTTRFWEVWRELSPPSPRTGRWCAVAVGARPMPRERRGFSSGEAFLGAAAGLHGRCLPDCR